MWCKTAICEFADRSYDVMTALNSDYTSVYYVDLNKNISVRYINKLTDKTSEEIFTKGHKQHSDAMRYYIENYISDPLRAEAADAIKALHDCGISKIVMMTGDNEQTAKAVAAKVGVDEFHAGVLPEDKANFIKGEHEKGRKVIMIVDGVNDSPALSEADAGIAINTGAAIAKEIADITVSSEDLYMLVTLRKISSALMKRIHRNYRFIVSFNLMLILLGVGGIIQPTTSALFHNASTLAISLKSMTNLIGEKEQK